MNDETINGYRVRVYDSGPETGDRYTVVYLDRELHGFTPEYIWRTGRDLWPMLGMNAHPFHPCYGVGQHTEGKLGRHLGRRIPFAKLPEDCQRAAMQDLTPSKAELFAQ